MNIEISKDEYRNLLDILYISDWVMNAHRIGADPRTEAYGKLEQKLFSYAKAEGFEHLVEYEPEYDEFFPTAELDDSIPARDFIDEYDDYTFWDELTYRLALRDLARKLGGMEKVDELSTEQRIENLSKLEDKYDKVFQTNGLNNLETT